MQDKLIDIIKEVLNKQNIEIPIEVTKPKDASNGDYATNIAMKLAGTLHQNPMDIASNIVANINDDEIIKMEIKNPGFINFFVKKDYLLENINRVLEEKENYGRNNIGKGKKVNIEFVSANPTGILHLGNARGGRDAGRWLFWQRNNYLSRKNLC